MGHYFVRLTEGDASLLMLWSTVVDAPIIIFDDVADIEQYTREQFGETGIRELPERLKRLEEKGTSSYVHTSGESVVCINRAGSDETCLSVSQIIGYYGQQKWSGKPPRGRDVWAEADEAEQAVAQMDEVK